MNKKMLSAAILLAAGTMGFIADALAFPEFVVPTGAKGCTDCHLDDEGNGYKPGVLEAAKGGLPALKACLENVHAGRDCLYVKPVTPGKAIDTPPVLNRIQDHWDVTVGDAALVIPLLVSDAEDDMFTISATTKVPTAASVGIKLETLSQERTDVQTGLSAIDFKWQPTAAQANKIYSVEFYAQEKGAGRNKVSNKVKATITVWPARDSKTKNISQLNVQRAQWSNNRLNLAGAVVFKAGLTAAQRKAALNTLNLKMRTNSGLAVGGVSHLSVDANGNWKKTIPLSASAVPCTIKLEYEGLNATRPVKLAPKACLQ